MDRLHPCSFQISFTLLSIFLWLVGEAKGNTKRRVDITLPLLLGDDVPGVLVQTLDVLGIELDEIVLVGCDALGSDRLGQDGVASGDYGGFRSATFHSQPLFLIGLLCWRDDLLWWLSRTLTGVVPFFSASLTMGSTVASGLPVLPRGL